MVANVLKFFMNATSEGNALIVRSIVDDVTKKFITKDPNP